jgi:hypothetical protein
LVGAGHHIIDSFTRLGGKIAQFARGTIGAAGRSASIFAASHAVTWF